MRDDRFYGKGGKKEGRDRFDTRTIDVIFFVPEVREQKNAYLR